LSFFGAFFDNMYFFFRVSLNLLTAHSTATSSLLISSSFPQIGCFDWSSEAMDVFINRLSTLPTIIIYGMEIWCAIYDSFKEAKGDRAKLIKLLKDKRLIFIAKLCEFPMQFWYLE
jgi:hypothetical protein